MIFWLTITALILIALLIMTMPYWRKQDINIIDNADLNILLYKRRLVELENDFKNDVLDKEQLAAATSELKLQLLSDVPEEPKENSENHTEERKLKITQWSTHTIITILVLVPVFSISLYFQLGNKNIATNNIEAVTKQVAPDVEKMIAGLAERLKSNPDDARGWMMLGRSYVAMNQYDNALSAYEKAYALAPENADVLTYYAETIGILHNNQLQGRPLELIMKALSINKAHPRALWLAGHAQLQLGNKNKAIKFWQTLLFTLPPKHASAKTVRKFIAQINGQPANQANSQTDMKKTAAPKSTAQGIKVKVRLAEKFKSTVSNDANVFIFARAAKGPKIPLAGVRLGLGDLPVELVLNDDNAMIPGRTISSVAQVIIGARVSKGGGPISKPGDLEGYSLVISSAHPGTLEIIINQIAK